MFCGTDIIEVSRIKDSILSANKFLEKIYTKEEIEDVDKINSEYKYQRYAGKFAAKEAIFKAISYITTKNNITVGFKDFEVLNDNELKRRPYVNILNEEIKSLLVDYNIDISISHIKDIASAICILVKKDESLL